MKTVLLLHAKKHMQLSEKFRRLVMAEERSTSQNNSLADKKYCWAFNKNLAIDGPLMSWTSYWHGRSSTNNAVDIEYIERIGLQTNFYIISPNIQAS